MEGKRVGGGLKLEGEEQVVENDAETEERMEEDEIEAVNAFDEDEIETPTQQQSKKRRKRPLEDLTPDPDSSQTPRPKKLKQTQPLNVGSTSIAEKIFTNGAILSAPETDDWQDPDAFALAQNEINTTDLARPETDLVFEESGQNDAGGDDELEFEDFDGGNEVEEARHPGANLPQPHGEQEERDLVSIRLEGTGEVVDPREPTTPAKSKRKEKKEKKKGTKEEKGRAPPVETSPAVPSSSVSKSERKEKQKQKSRQSDKAVKASSSIAIPSSQPSKISTPSKAVDSEATSKALSNDERRKLKKLRQKDTKKEREDGRMRKKEARA